MNKPAGSDDEDRIAKALEKVHDGMIAGSPSQDFATANKSDPKLVSAAEVLDLLERVREATPDLRSGAHDGPSAYHQETAVDFSTPGDFCDTKHVRELPQSIGRFQIRRQLGKGGHGLVFLAFDPRLEREVALKVPRLESFLDDEMRSRFIQEAQAAAGLNHPNIVPVFESGEAGPIHFIATRFVDGVSLSQWLSVREQPISHHAAAELVATLAGAMEHAHAIGVVHRDIKPSNILLDNNKNRESPIDASSISSVAAISDFGLAKFLDRQSLETRTDAIVGTPSYMAPEQTGNKQAIGPWTDIYGLGALLYELLTGNAPFQRDSVLETVKAVQEDEPVHPRHVVRDIPTDLESVCLKCLEKSPADRYPSAQELQLDLQRFLDGRPVEARRITRWHRFTKFAARNKAITSLAALLFLTLAVSSVVSMMYGIQANRQTAIAQREAERSREAIFELFSKITEHPEFKAQGMESVRQSMLKQASRMYNDLVRDAPGDTVARRSQSESILLLAKISSTLGDKQQSTEYLEQIVANTNPTTTTDQIRQAAYKVELGKSLYDLGQSKAGQEYFEQAKRRLRPLASRASKSMEATVALATALSVEARCCETRTQTSKTLAAVNEALACWERVALNAHAHWGHDAQVAECLLLRGQCEQVNGELTAAAKTTAEAIELLDDLLEREPSNVTFKERLAIGRQTLGVIHSHLSEFSFAEQEYQQSLNQFNQLAIQHPGVPAYQGRAAGVRYSLGFLQYSTGQFESALKTLSRNVSITKSLAERYPQMNSQFLQSCATNQQLLYGVYDKLDRNGEARESLEASIETYQAILDKIPDNNFVVTQLGNSYVMLGKSLLVSENHDASHQAIEVAIGRLRNALEMAPDYARAKVYLADAYDCQIAIFDHQGDWPQAIKASTSFVEFAQTPDQMLKAAACRVNVFVQSGKIEQAILTFHTTKFDAENASSLGCYLATREFADSIARIEANESLSPTEIQFVESLVQTATRWLEHASKLGHFKNSGVIAAESDEALAALLKHPAYQKRLVTE